MEIDSEFATSIIKNIGQFWSNEQLADLKIIIEGEAFSCCKFHLCACSEFFNTLFKSNAPNTSKTNSPVVYVRGVKPNIFSLVMKAVFKGENLINEENMEDLWLAAYHFQINFLICKVELFIADRVTNANYLYFYPKAIKLSSDFVLQKIISFMAQDFDNFCTTSTFFNLRVQDLSKLVQLKNFNSYDKVVTEMLKWVNFNDHHSDNISEHSAQINDTNVNSMLKSQPERNVDSVEILLSYETLPAQQQFTDRKDHIEEIVAHVQLELVSKETLLLLLDDDLIMGNRQARIAVKNCIALQMEKAKNLSNTPITPVNINANIPVAVTDPTLRNVVLFLDTLNKAKMIAYDIFSGQFYHIQKPPGCGEIDKIFVCNNQMFLLTCTENNSKSKLLFSLTSTLGLEKSVEIANENGDFFMQSESFLYRFHIDNKWTEISRRTFHSIHNGTWNIILKGEVNGILIHIVKYKNFIIAFYKGQTLENNKRAVFIYSFDTITRNYIYLSKYCVKDALPLASFHCNNSLFALERSGELVEISENDGTLQVKTHSPLWDNLIGMTGAVLLNNVLYIFTREPFHGKISCPIGEVKCVYLLKDADICHYLTISQACLLEEI